MTARPVLSRIRSRLLRDTKADNDDAAAAVEFAELLCDSLEIPEVVALLRAVVRPAPAAPPPPRPPALSARGSLARRGR